MTWLLNLLPRLITFFIAIFKTEGRRELLSEIERSAIREERQRKEEERRINVEYKKKLARTPNQWPSNNSLQ